MRSMTEVNKDLNAARQRMNAERTEVEKLKAELADVRRAERAAAGPKFPNIEVELSGQDGNAFGMVSRTRAALKRGGATREQEEEFFNDALSGDYDHVLQTIMAWVTVR